LLLRYAAARMAQSLTLQTIGYVRAPAATRVEAARQPRAARGVPGQIELLPGHHYEHALEDLAGWEYIWVLFWFDRNPGWRPKVLPPRSRSGRKGVFATRSPHRPNPLGLSVLRLERIDGLTLHVRDVDMLDGTPVFDIKPYVAYTDAIVDARAGWLDDAGDEGAAVDPVAGWLVEWLPLAAEQAAWVEQQTQLPLRQRVEATLTLGPAPHPYRRIRRDGAGGVLAVKEWRVGFTVIDRSLQINSVQSGYRPSQLAGHDPRVVHRQAHQAFRALWPTAP
jgi:tRNA-Thr(GGU) m(6)t(6)A37 methyltransferase TsaA